MIVLVLELKPNPSVTVQTFNFCFRCGKLAQAAAFAAAGLLTLRIGASTLPLALVCSGGLQVGVRARLKVIAAACHRWLRHTLRRIAVLLLLQ